LNILDLIDWREKDKSGEQENLLFSETTSIKPNPLSVPKNDTKSEASKEKFPHLKTKIWIQFVHDTNPYHPGAVPPQMSENKYRKID